MLIGTLFAVILVFAIPAFFHSTPLPQNLVWAAVAAAFPLSLITLILINLKGTLKTRLNYILETIDGFALSLEAKRNEELAANPQNAGSELARKLQVHISGVRKLKRQLATNYQLKRYQGSFAFVAAVYSFLFFFAFNKILPITEFGTLQTTLGKFPNSATAALLGAWAYALYSVISRITSADLSPEFLLRLSYQPIIAIAFAFFSTFMFAEDFLIFISFGIGFLPYPEIVRYIRVKTQQKMNADSNAADNAERQSNLSEIEGIDFDEIERLHEENIKNIQQLAFSNPLEIHFSTAYPLKTIIDWNDQALLRLYVNKAQLQALRPIGIRGAIEMAQVRRRIREYETKLQEALDAGNTDLAAKIKSDSETLLTSITSALGTQPTNIKYLAYQLGEDPHVEFVYFLYDELASP